MNYKTLLLGATLLSASALQATDAPSVKAEGIGYIKQLGKALKSELKAHMQKDPTGLEALAFCTGSAKSITQKVNASLPPYASVRRTALKVRNETENMPDALDKKVMEQMQTRLETNATALMGPQGIVVVEEGNTTRVYKPLLTKKVCLKCHGSTLSPKIEEALQSAYPHDHAVGFKEGDLRGVMVAEIKKHPKK